MSNFYRVTKHPITGKWEKAEWLDNYFGHREYGVRFPDGNVFREHLVSMEDSDDHQSKQ